LRHAKPIASVSGEILRHWQEAVPNDRFAHLVKHAARGLARALQMRLAEHGVSYGHWTFLRVLWETEGLTQRELSAQAGVMEPTTFSALQAMARLGYIVRRPGARSRKEVHVHLTPKGRALKAKLVPLAEEVNAVALAGTDAADIAATRRTLFAVIENLATDEIASADTRRLPSTRAMSQFIQDAATRDRSRKADPEIVEGRPAARRARSRSMVGR
jgi:DNA-binding MarR family transcriptional regulator